MNLEGKRNINNNKQKHVGLRNKYDMTITFKIRDGIIYF